MTTPTPEQPSYSPQPPTPLPPVPSYASSYAQQAPIPAPHNALAIIAFIGAFFYSLIAIILGHIALSQIKRSGERGRGLALAATIIGYVRIVLEAIAIILFLVFAGVFASIAANSSSSDYSGSTYSSSVQVGSVRG